MSKWLKTDKEVPEKMGVNQFNELAGKKKKNKYNNTGKGTSKLEKKHEAEYRLLLKAEQIKSYESQKRFMLQEGFRRDGKAIRAITYIADHYIIHLDGSEEVCDSKGMETEVFRIKRKLFLKRYPDIKFRVRKK